MTTAAIAAGVWLLSSLTLTTGIGGGAAYTPLLVILLGLDVPTAIGTSVLTQLGGVATTAAGHAAAGRSDLGLAGRLTAAAVAGLFAVRLVLRAAPTELLEPTFVLALLVVAVWLVADRHAAQPLLPSQSITWTRLVTAVRAGPIYAFCHPGLGYALAGLAGAATGLLGISGAEVQISGLILRCRLPPRAAVGTGTVASVLPLAAAAAWATVHGQVAWHVAAISVPAAVLGARTSRLLAGRLPAVAMRRGIATVMVLAAAEIGLRRAVL